MQVDRRIAAGGLRAPLLDIAHPLRGEADGLGDADQGPAPRFEGDDLFLPSGSVHSANMASHNGGSQRDPIAVRRETMTASGGSAVETVGERIKRARKAAGLTRTQLAEQSGVRYPTLAGLENGDQKTSTALPSLAHVLGVTALWLATGRGYGESVTVQPEELTVPESSHHAPITSHFGRLTPAILAHAEKWVRFEEGAGDRFTPEGRAERLLALCALAIEDGGSLSPDHSQQIIDAARTRQKQRGVKGGRRADGGSSE